LRPLTRDITEFAAFVEERDFEQHPAVFSGLPRSHLQQATPNRNGNCVRSVIGPQLVHEVFDVEVDSSLSNCQLIGNLLVAVAITNEPEHLQLSGR
jgi:hypothetical protein